MRVYVYEVIVIIIVVRVVLMEVVIDVVDEMVAVSEDEVERSGIVGMVGVKVSEGMHLDVC